MTAVAGYQARTVVTKMKLYSIEELVNAIYEDNLNHFEFHENMGGEDCDCHIHTTIKTIVEYWETDLKSSLAGVGEGESAQ